MKCNFNIEDYKKYYSSIEFQRDLMSWYNIKPSSSTPKYPFIGHAAWKFNPNRKAGIPSSTKEKSFYFSFCIFFHSLQAQAIYKLSGKSEMDRFHAETGVPMISCGLGGLMHPAHILLESDLLPEGVEIPEYIRMIDLIFPAIRSQIDELQKYADNNQLYMLVEEEIKSFRQRLAENESHPTYFLQNIYGDKCSK